MQRISNPRKSNECLSTFLPLDGGDVSEG